MTSFQKCQDPDLLDKQHDKEHVHLHYPVTHIHIWRMLLKSGSKAKQLQTEN
jgi:hypothetical protein